MSNEQRAINIGSKWSHNDKFYIVLFSSDWWVVIDNEDSGVQYTWRVDSAAPRHFLDNFKLIED